MMPSVARTIRSPEWSGISTEVGNGVSSKIPSTVPVLSNREMSLDWKRMLA